MISTELKAFLELTLFCMFNYLGASCMCVCARIGAIALESNGEWTAEGTSTLLDYSRGGCVGTEICEIPVVELRKSFLDKNRARSRPDPFYRQYALEKPSWAERERVRKRARERYGEWEALTQL